MALSITLRAVRGNIVNLTRNARPVRIRQLGGSKKRVFLSFAPLVVDYQDVGRNYVTIDRPADSPILAATTKKLRTLSVSTVLVDRASNHVNSIESLLEDLAIIATEDADCLFVYGTVALPFRVRLTDFTYSSVGRNIQGEITRANVDLRLTEKPVMNTTPVTIAAIQYTPDPVPSNHQAASPDPDPDEYVPHTTDPLDVHVD